MKTMIKMEVLEIPVIPMEAVSEAALIPGPQGEPGRVPVKGVDYWTQEDREELVADVLEALPTYHGEAEDL